MHRHSPRVLFEHDGDQRGSASCWCTHPTILGGLGSGRRWPQTTKTSVSPAFTRRRLAHGVMPSQHPLCLRFPTSFSTEFVRILQCWLGSFSLDTYWEFITRLWIWRGEANPWVWFQEAEASCDTAPTGGGCISRIHSRAGRWWCATRRVRLHTAQFWKRKVDSNGIASLGLERTFDMNKLLSLNLEKHHMMTLQYL